MLDSAKYRLSQTDKKIDFIENKFYKNWQKFS